MNTLAAAAETEDTAALMAVVADYDVCIATAGVAFWFSADTAAVDVVFAP